MPGTSVVTAERFAKGYTYKDYLASVKANKDQFERNEKEFKLKAEDAKFFADQSKRLAGVKVVAIGEDWCPDVWRGLPIIARIAEAAGLELRIFPRDQNMDIENEHLNQGKFASIPVFAFYGPAFRPLNHWIERPKAAYEFYDKLNKDLAGMSEEQARTERRSRSAPEQEKWRQETVKELKELFLHI